MRNIIVAILLLLFAGCTSSHRLVAIYESGEAVNGPVKVLDKTVTPEAKKDEAKEDSKDDSGNILSDLLP